MIAAKSHDHAAMAQIKDHISANRLGNRFADGALTVRTTAYMIGKILGADHTECDVRASLMQTIKSTLTSGGYDTGSVPVHVLHCVVNYICNTTISRSDIAELQQSYRTHHESSSASQQLVPSGILDDPPLVADGEPFQIVPSTYHDDLADMQALYNTMSPADFCAMVVSMKHDHDADIAQLKDLEAEKASMARSRSYYKNKCIVLENSKGELQDKLVALESKINYRPGLRNISLYGGYLLAVKRNIGNTGSKSLVAIVAGDELNGAFKDAKLVTRFEHRACWGQRLRSKQIYADHDAELQAALPGDLELARLVDSLHHEPMSIQFVQYVGDASNVDAVQKEKVHVGQVACMTVPVAELLGAPDLNTLRFKYTRSICDLQRVHVGSGEEFYAIVQEEMKSVGAPLWTNRVAAGGGRTVTVYLFALDKGPDNQGGCRRIRDEVKRCPFVMFHAQWCIFHQLHIIVELVFRLLDGFEWTDAEGNFETAYFSGLKIIANTWRSSGSPPKIYKAGVIVTGSIELANLLFLKIIGRCLRGRWGAGHEVEGTIGKSSEYIGEVFNIVFPDPKAKGKKQWHDAEPDDYREMLGRWRRISKSLANNAYFKAMVKISHIAKKPLMSCLHWCYDRNKQVKVFKKASDSSGSAYTGPTCLSDLVVFKAAEVKQDLCDLLTCDPSPIDGVLATLPETAHADANALFVQLVCVQLGAWEQRVIEPMTSFPLLFLLMVEKPPAEFCGQRQGIAKRLLDTHDCCLVNAQSDLALKAKRMWYGDFKNTSESGKLGPELYGFLIGLRAMMVSDTQFIEGINNVIQAMCKLAPNMHLPLVNARLSLKQNPVILATELVELHTAIVEQMNKPEAGTGLCQWSLPLPRSQLQCHCASTKQIKL